MTRTRCKTPDLQSPFGGIGLPREDVVAFGGIPDAFVLGVRSSDRLRAQPFADSTSMERAMLLAQRRDFPTASGTPFKYNHSILNIPNEVIVSRAAKLGVSLGVSPSQVASSVNKIKNVEVERSITFLKKNLPDVEGDDPYSLVVRRASRLSEDLISDEEEGGGGTCRG